MQPDLLHPDYEEHQAQWKRCRETAAGSDAVKKAGTKYLPMLGGHEDKPQLYDAYKMRGLFLEAVPRTVQGLSGAVFRKEPEVVKPKANDVKDFLTDLSGNHQPLGRFAQCLLDETLKISRVGIWVTMDAESRPGNKPRLALVPGENITNWADDGSWLILKEQAPEEGSDPMEHKKVDQWRYFYLDELGKLVVELWQENKEAPQGEQGEKFRMVDQFFPERMKERLDFIPVIVIAGTEIGTTVRKPDLLGLVDANLHHYRLSTDYAHGLHWTGLPTPWAAGLNNKKEVTIGSGTMLQGPQGATFGMLEFSGQGLTPLKEALEAVVDYMASLGARLLERSKQAVEAAETIRLRTNAEQSAVEAMAWAVSEGLTKAVRWALWWGNMAKTPDDESFSITLNTDLVDVEVDTELFKIFHDALIAGNVAYETFYQFLERMELNRPGVDAEQERRDIGEVEDDTFSEAAG